jgi:exopolysaccharide production protein ExoQ
MSSQIAASFYFLCILWLLRTDHKQGRRLSLALSIPLCWFLLVASKSPMRWAGDLGIAPPGTEGGLLDTAVFFLLLAFGTSILSRRSIGWRELLINNKWLVLYYAYAGLSVFWTDEPFNALKQWVKDLGNLVMVLVILSDNDRSTALRGTLLKSSYILVLVSLLLVKYYPAIGTGYDQWTGQPRITGISTNKNGLGATLLVCLIAIIWSFQQIWRERPRSKQDIFIHGIIGLITVWLLAKSHSATSLACAVVGGGMLIALSLPFIQRSVSRLGVGIFIYGPLLVMVLQVGLGVGDLVFWLLGRDLTLTSRTKIWEWCFRMDVNPLLGAGYCGFWNPERARTISEGIGFFYVLKEAHNGYIEAYLNCGAAGLVLLILAILSGIHRILKFDGAKPYEAMRLVLVIVALAYNISESAFNGLNPIWFLLLLAIVYYPESKLRLSESSPY